MYRISLLTACLVAIGWIPQETRAESPLRGSLKTLDDHFPFVVPETAEAWQRRSEELRTRVAVATGMHPMLPRGPVKVIRHSSVQRDGFRFEKFYFESVPGHFVTGLLFSPKSPPRVDGGKYPAVLSPHGHGGRLMRYNDKTIAAMIEHGDEKFVESGRRPKLARCAQLARMGCVVMIFDMVGYADSIQVDYLLAHRRHGSRSGESVSARSEPQLFFSTPAESRCQSIMGLQTYNALRAFDCLASLPEVDPKRVAVTGGSGGGTQSILLGALEPRVACSFPNGMVSTAMQGGCACENATLLRIGTGNVELAALMAPRPMAMTAADDWTKDMMTDGFPQLRELYSMLGVGADVQCTSLLQFKHNYNYVTRRLMYDWMNRHLQLDAADQLDEQDFPEITDDEMGVWDESHPSPVSRGRSHEREILTWWDEQSSRSLAGALGRNANAKSFDKLVRPAIETIFDCRLPTSNAVQWKANGESKQIDQWDWQRGWVVDSKRNRRIAAQRWVLRSDSVQVTSEGNSPSVDDGSRNVVKLLVTNHAKVAAADPLSLPNALTEDTVNTVAILAIGEAESDLVGAGTPGVGGLAQSRQQPINPQPRRTAAAFTFGYNRPLAVRRTADILAATSLAQSIQGLVVKLQKKPQESIEVELHADGPLAVSALAASALAGSAIGRASIHIARFRFGDLRYQSDEQFVPGMVKYGDVDALAAMRAPLGLTLSGEMADDFPTASALYRHHGAGESLHCMIRPALAD